MTWFVINVVLVAWLLVVIGIHVGRWLERRSATRTARLRAEVVRAALHFWRVSHADADAWHRLVGDADLRFGAACAALDAAEKERSA